MQNVSKLVLIHKFKVALKNSLTIYDFNIVLKLSVERPFWLEAALWWFCGCLEDHLVLLEILLYSFKATMKIAIRKIMLIGLNGDINYNMIN